MKIFRLLGRASVLLLALYALCIIAATIPAKLTMRTLYANLWNSEKVTILPGPMFSGVYASGSRILAQTSEPKEIADFLGSLRIQPSLTQLFGARCACGGDFRVVVDRKGAEPFAFTLHHGYTLRLPRTIAGDASLTPDAAYDLAVWLSRHGVFEHEKDVQPGVPANPRQSSGR